MVRRGFPWRSEGEEGLAFLAAAKSPDVFARALDAMTGASGPTDRLLGWARPISAALYYAPPS